MENEKKTCCCCSDASAEPTAPAAADVSEGSCCRHKDRTPEEHKALLNRLSRIEGQVRGIRGMLEKDAYCGYPCAGGGCKQRTEQLFQRAAQPASAHLRG